MKNERDRHEQIDYDLGLVALGLIGSGIIVFIIAILL